MATPPSTRRRKPPNAHRGTPTRSAAARRRGLPVALLLIIPSALGLAVF